MTKSNSSSLLLPLFLAALLLSSGCVLYDYRTGATISNLEKLGITNNSINLTPNNICAPLNESKPCYCMVCENKTSGWDLPILSWWYDTNLKKGECRFDVCNMTTFSDMLSEGGSTQPRVFMIGNGPSFASTGQSNLFCNYSLQMAVKWLTSESPGNPPRKEQMPSRAACWLGRNVLPIYIYYTNGSAISPQRTREFAESLELAGAYPSIITTEINFNSSDAAAMKTVKDQIVEIKRNCPKCLSVLAVRSRDVAAVKEVLGDPTPRLDGRNLSNLTDMVGFGFLANDYSAFSYAGCNPARIVATNLDFSRFILMNYSKPTIWLYVGVSEGNNTDGTCYFTNQSAHQFYQKIFSAIPGLASSGVVGMNFYEFSDRTGPLPCNGVAGCDFGVMDSNGNQKHPEMNSWSNLCQFVATDTFRNPLIFSRNGKGFVCDGFQNWNIYSQISTEVNTELGLKSANITPLSKIPGLTCGEACISPSANREPNTYGAGSSFNFNPDKCSVLPIIDEYADSADISSTYVRAVIQQESGFEQMAVSCVPATGNNGCNKDRPTSDGDTRNYYHMSEICEMAGVRPENCPAECPDNQKPCAFGLSQCTEYPGKAYVDAQMPIPSEISSCGGENYNPFNPSNNICCGVNKIRQNLQVANAFLSENWGTLSACPNSMTLADKPWAAYYLSALLYYGMDYKSQIADFAHARGSDCTGEQNFIKYLRSLPSNSPPGYDYGAQVMSRYFDAVGKCSSDCPGK